MRWIVVRWPCGGSVDSWGRVVSVEYAFSDAFGTISLEAVANVRGEMV